VLSAPAVLTRTLVLGSLALFIGAVYLALPVGLGIGLGWGPNTTLSVAATVVVALLFSRVREKSERIALRLVQGERATPVEVLTELSDRMAGPYSTPDMLPQMARILALGSGAAGARVWLRLSDELVPAASWPEADSLEFELGPVRVVGDDLPPLPDAHFGLPIRLGDELVGAVTVTQSPGEPLSPADLALLEHMASEAGPVVRNVRLTAQLAGSLEEISSQAVEIRASRKRIVEAQDAERRRVERDIHDGAQQHLVGLMVQLRVANRVVHRDPDRARRIMGDARDLVTESLERLAELAQGIHPRFLSAEGLAGALLREHRNPSVHVTVEDHGVGRYQAEVEAAVYFTCLEALNNAAKHAAGANVAVRLAEEDGHLVFSVSDDGSGFDPDRCRPGSGLGNMSDRVAALRGSLTVTSVPSRGTSVTGRIPLEGLAEGVAR
jgi:signal transduction histidine kinase